MPADLLVYTVDEWLRLQEAGGRFARTLTKETVWFCGGATHAGRRRRSACRRRRHARSALTQGTRTHVMTGPDVDQYASAIKARGRQLDQKPQDGWGMRAFSIGDPDGFKLTFMAMLTKQGGRLADCQGPCTTAVMADTSMSALSASAVGLGTRCDQRTCLFK